MVKTFDMVSYIINNIFNCNMDSNEIKTAKVKTVNCLILLQVVMEEMESMDLNILFVRENKQWFNNFYNLVKNVAETTTLKLGTIKQSEDYNTALQQIRSLLLDNDIVYETK